MRGAFTSIWARAAIKRPALQPFFQRPGGVLRMAGLDDEKEGRVEAEAHEPGSVRAPPFARGALRQAPQHEPGGCIAAARGSQLMAARAKARAAGASR